jgi:hypothetical protein
MIRRCPCSPAPASFATMPEWPSEALIRAAEGLPGGAENCIGTGMVLPGCSQILIQNQNDILRAVRTLMTRKAV